MNIQIRSFVKGGNHGQYFQALGLKVLVEKILPSANVSHLDYENHFWKELGIQILGGMLPKFLVMRMFWRKNIRFSSLKEIPDISIYGSDMIWHMNSELFPIDKQLFGELDEAKFKVAYAPSVGSRGGSEPDWLSEKLDDYFAIGVRDNQTLSLVADHSKKAADLVIDPCFYLLDSKYNSAFSNVLRQDFVSVYSPLSYRLVDSFKANLIESDLPDYISNVKYLGYFPRKRLLADICKQFTDPLWTLQQVACSKLLVTSTFHGVMMALMTDTPFLAVNSPNLAARLDSPIAKAFSEDRLMTMEQMKNIDNRSLERFLTNADIDSAYVREYVTKSKSWMERVLKSCVL